MWPKFGQFCTVVDQVDRKNGNNALNPDPPRSAHKNAKKHAKAVRHMTVRRMGRGKGNWKILGRSSTGARQKVHKVIIGAMSKRRRQSSTNLGHTFSPMTQGLRKHASREYMIVFRVPKYHCSRGRRGARIHLRCVWLHRWTQPPRQFLRCPVRGHVSGLARTCEPPRCPHMSATYRLDVFLRGAAS